MRWSNPYAFVIPFFVAAAATAALADDAAAPAAPPSQAVEAAPEPNPVAEPNPGPSAATAVAQPKKARRGAREKEAEGTQAPNRFEADTVIKSQYRLDGQPLEVDPD